MNSADCDQLDEEEKKRFYRWERSAQIADMRQVDDRLFHEDHIHRLDIQCGGSERLGESKQ